MSWILIGVMFFAWIGSALKDGGKTKTTVDCATLSHFDATSGHSEMEVDNGLR